MHNKWRYEVSMLDSINFARERECIESEQARERGTEMYKNSSAIFQIKHDIEKALKDLPCALVLKENLGGRKTCIYSILSGDLATNQRFFNDLNSKHISSSELTFFWCFYASLLSDRCVWRFYGSTFFFHDARVSGLPSLAKLSIN